MTTLPRATIAAPLPKPLPKSLPRLGASVLAMAVIFAALLPTLLVEIPALVDYPNHLARMSILARDGTPAAHPYYQVAWALYPNLAIDLVVPFLARWMDVPAATKLFYLTAQVLIIGGTMAVGYAARRQLLLPAIAATLLLYAPPFAWGFVNFAFGLGIALWAFAVWIWLAGAPLVLRLVVHAFFVAILFFAHLLALGLYGLMAGGYELWRLSANRASPTRWVLTFGGMALPVVLLIVVMKATGGAVGGTGNEWFLANKLNIILELNGLDKSWSRIASVILFVSVILASQRGLIRLAGAGPWLATILLVAFVAMPGRLMDTSFVDGRVWVVLMLMLGAFAQIPRASRSAPLLIGILASLSLANSAYTAWIQWDYAKDYRAMLTALEKVPMRARILIARTGPEDDPPEDRLDYPMFHAALLGIHTRDALAPTLFAYPGKQPVRPRPEVAALTIPQGGPVPLDIVTAIARGEKNPTGYAFLTDWPQKFGYVVLLEVKENPLPDRLELLAQDRRFALYRVKLAQ